MTIPRDCGNRFSVWTNTHVRRVLPFGRMLDLFKALARVEAMYRPVALANDEPSIPERKPYNVDRIRLDSEEFLPFLSFRIDCLDQDVPVAPPKLPNINFSVFSSVG